MIQLSNSICWGQPVNRSSPLNRGLRTWHWTPPGCPVHYRWFDLCKRQNAPFNSGAPVTLVGNQGRPGGSRVLYSNSGRSDVPGEVYQGMSKTTIACWVKTTATGQRSIADRDIPGIRLWQFRMSGNKAQFIPFNTAGTPNSVTSTTSINDGKWHHIITAWDGSAISMYIDGIKDATDVSFSGSLPNSTLTLYISLALPGWTGSAAWADYLDDLRVYDRGLTSTEAWQLYNASRTGYKKELNFISPVLLLQQQEAALQIRKKPIFNKFIKYNRVN